MPIYQYKCQGCLTIVELMQRINEPPLTECSSCGRELKKIIAPAGIIFKGSGFHVTDYKSAGNSAEASSADKKSEEKGSDKSAKKEEKTTSEKDEGTSGKSDKISSEKASKDNVAA